MHTTITIPPEMLAPVRSGLHTVLGGAAQQIAEVSERAEREQHPEWYAEPREHLALAVAALDALGWRERREPAGAQLDLSEHSWAVLAALDVARVVAEDDLREADHVDDERTRRGEPPKRRATSELLDAVRELAWAIRLRVGVPQRPGCASGEPA